MKMKHQPDRRPADEPGLHRVAPPSGGGVYVEPRIQAIERRMQMRTPEPKIGRNRPPAAAAPDGAGDDGTTTTAGDKSVGDDNAALVLHSPILSSILPHSNIKRFESDLLKKQAQYAARISDLEGRLATFHARLGTECAERGREHAFTMEEYVDGPLERAARRSLGRIESEFVGPIMDPRRAATAAMPGGNATAEVGSGAARSSARTTCENDVGDAVREERGGGDDIAATMTTNTLPNLVAIERRTNLLEAQMNHHEHVTLFRSRRENFDAIDAACRQTLQPALALEMTKADKREGGMVRRFEASGGEYARLVSEMTSSRASSLGYIEKEIDGWDISDLSRAEHYLEEIQKLKQRVMEEREERIRQDRLVVERIVRNREMLQEDIYLAC